MATDFYYVPSKNGIQKTLSSILLNTATTGDPISLSDVDGIQNKKGVLVINAVDANGIATPSSREYISFSSVSASTVIIETRNVDGSSSAKTHAVGSVVQFVPDVVWAQRMTDQILVGHNIDGTHSTAGVASITSQASTDESPILNSSMARQAIINGNFDVWQRGTSGTITGATVMVADRYATLYTTDGWTFPTVTHSRQLLTSGDIPGAFFHYRIATNGAGSGTLGNTTEHGLYYRVENGTRNLCGAGKKLTFSVWMKASSAKKVIVNFSQRYGTGGSPSANEIIKGVITTLSTSWTKYTYTITTNTLAGKTFGTANDDYFQIRFDYIWNPTKAATITDDSASNETFGAANNIDIAQVQLCAGDVALPFQPKSFDDELRACQRYYEKSYNYATAPGTANYTTGATYANSTIGNALFFSGLSASTLRRFTSKNFKVKKRITSGTVRYWDGAGNLTKMSSANGDMGWVADNIFETYQGVYASEDDIVAQTAANVISFVANWEVSCEL